MKFIATLLVTLTLAIPALAQFGSGQGSFGTIGAGSSSGAVTNYTPAGVTFGAQSAEKTNALTVFGGSQIVSGYSASTNTYTGLSGHYVSGLIVTTNVTTLDGTIASVQLTTTFGPSNSIVGNEVKLDSGWDPEFQLTGSYSGGVIHGGVDLACGTLELLMNNTGGEGNGTIDLDNGGTGLHIDTSGNVTFDNGLLASELTGVVSAPINTTALTNNGLVWYSVKTNATPNFSAPSGSICTTTNGQFFVRSNSVWLLK
jgi:hypothetical protein